MEELCRQGMWDGLRASMPCPGVPHSQHLHVFTNSEALQTSYFGDFMEASSRRHNGLLTPFSALLPSHEKGEQGLKFQASHLGAHQSCLIRTKDIPITQEITRVSFQEPCVRNWGQRTNSTKDAPSALNTYKITRVLGDLSKKLGRDNIYFLLSHTYSHQTFGENSTQEH